MRIQFVQSGGFAGTIRHCSLDTASMSKAEAAELEALVHKAELDSTHLEGATSASRAANARDLEDFHLSIEDESGKKTIVRDQSTLSPGGKALVAYLKKCAKPGLPPA